jgi:hypothetical protein
VLGIKCRALQIFFKLSFNLPASASQVLGLQVCTTMPSDNLISLTKIYDNFMAEGMAQVVDPLPGKHKALTSNPSTTKTYQPDF